jgi:VIT1/CCC1 family predicted Fe2+/Mn2+ transporter
MRKIPSNLMRSFVFGVEDSVVSTAGLVSGIAAIGTGRGIILATGCILIFVEAFSMAVGDMVSDNEVNEIRLHGETPLSKSFAPAIVMFVSYLFSGFIVLVPYVLFTPSVAMLVSIPLSLVLLFGLGAFGGRLSGTSLVRNGFTMASVGGVAILIGVLAGYIIQSLAGTAVL